jgi:tetratricopeptide (TPR) repeat protein
VKFARLLVAFALLVSFVRTAAAEDRAHARAAFRAGSQHYNLGEFQQALDSFREAYRNYEDPSFLFNIAQCERQLGHKREAVREYRAYLNNSDNTDNRETVKQTIAQLEREIAADDQRAAAAAEAARAAKNTAPPATTPAAATTSAEPSAATLTASAPPRAEHKPAYKKWWVWTIVGGVVAGGAAAGLAVVFTRPSSPMAPTTLGTAHPSF